VLIYFNRELNPLAGVEKWHGGGVKLLEEKIDGSSLPDESA
jgi:hypothetical protein